MNELQEVLELPETCALAAKWWFDFGLGVVPINPETKKTAVHWQPWLDGLNHKSITGHWATNPDHQLGAIVGADLFILDGDTPEARAAMLNLERAFDLEPNLIVKTRKGEHHYFRKAPGTYAVMQSFSTRDEPHKIDIRTGRTATEGRSIIVLPPSSHKEVELLEAGHVSELVEVDQAFIDAVARHNGKEPPRAIEPKRRTEMERETGSTQAAEILGYISPNVNYDDWLSVLMALNEEFQGSEQGLMLADQWSSTGDSYPGFEQIEYKWRSFSQGSGITFATVAKMAADAGADLKAIALKYDQRGNKRRTYSELISAAQGFKLDTDPEEIEALILESAVLPAIQKRKVHEAIRKTTKLPFRSIQEAERQTADDRDPDDLGLACGLVAEIGKQNVLATQSFVYRWRPSGVWKKQDERSVKQWVQTYIVDKVDAVRKNNVDSVADLLRTEIYRPNHVFDVGPVECVNTPSGELMLSDSGQWELLPHNREHYRTTQVPVEFEPKAQAPQFVKFLSSVFKGDPDAGDKATALLEMMGYTLMAHCNHERFIILVGSGANGKSVLLSVLEALAGRENVAAVQPSQFDNKFQRAHLHNKLANIVTEIKQGAVIDDDALKGITSGEPTTVEHKNKDPFDMRPFSTCWFGTNHMPHTRDFSGALFRRALVIEFNNKFTPEMGNCDPNLKNKLMEELPGILTLALDAYADALQEGFTMPESCRQAREKWRLEADQVAQFVEQDCEASHLERTEPQRLFNAYRDWAADNGIHNRLTQKSFIDRVVILGFERKKSNGRRFIVGLKCNRRGDCYE